MQFVFFGGCAACAGVDQRQWPGRQSQTSPLCLVWPGAQTAPGCAGLAQCPSTQAHEPERTTYCPPIQTWNLLGGAGRVTITTGGGGGAQPISTSATSTGTESLLSIYDLRFSICDLCPRHGTAKIGNRQS